MKKSCIKLPFGMNEHSKLVHISDVESGRKCKCICTSCSSKLVAVKGKQRQHHFRHDTGHECKHGLESAIHLAAKQIIMERKQIRLPECIASVCEKDSKGQHYLEQEKIVIDGTIISFDSVQDEISLSNIIADIVAIKGDTQLIIEVFYKHKVDEAKLLKIIDSNISAIEIDLSGLKPDDVRDWEAFWLHINNPSNIAWLHNVKGHACLNKLKSKLRVQINKAEEKYKKKELERADAERKEIPEYLDAIDKLKYLRGDEYKAQLANDTETHSFWKNKSVYNKLCLDRLPYFLNVDIIDGDWIFGCDRRIWQPAFYIWFIELDNKLFSTKRVCDWLDKEGYKAPDVVRKAQKYRRKYPQFISDKIVYDLPSVWRTLNKYFWYLHNLGVLEYTGEDYKNRGNYWFKPI